MQSQWENENDKNCKEKKVQNYISISDSWGFDVLVRDVKRWKYTTIEAASEVLFMFRIPCQLSNANLVLDFRG